MNSWALHCCLLDSDRWGPLGCDIRKHTGSGIPRVEMSTPWFYLSVALAPSGKFSKLRGYQVGMSKEQVRKLPVDTHWIFWKWQ